MDRKKYLDGWRACAVIGVLLAHFVSTFGFNLGRVGVELFFVLSGRLMAEILFIRETPLSSFFPRRVSRVYPALFVFATIIYLASSYLGGDPTPAQYLAAITFTTNYAQFWIGRSAVLDHIWSLCIEEHLYMLLGGLAFLHRRRRLPILAIVLALAIAAIVNGAAQTYSGLDYRDVYWRSDVRGASILLGVAAYLAFRHSVPKWLEPSWVPVALAIVGLLLNAKVVPDPIKYSLGSAAFAMAVVLLHRSPRIVIAVLEQPWLLRIGLWSFSIYLWQQPFSKVHGSLGERMVLLAVALVAAVASFYLVEQPARRFLNRAFGS